MDNDLGGLLFNGQKRPSRVSGVDGVADNGDFDPFTDNYFNRAAWADPGPLPSGTRRSVTARSAASRTTARTSTSSRCSSSAQKEFRFEAQFGNIFDRIVFCDPNQNFSSPAFGTVNTQCNTPRSAQLGFRFEF